MSGGAAPCGAPRQGHTRDSAIVLPIFLRGVNKVSTGCQVAGKGEGEEQYRYLSRCFAGN